MFWKIVIIHVESCFARRFLSCILWFVLSNSDCLVLLFHRQINLFSEVNSREGPQRLAIILKFGRLADGSGWGFFRFSLIVLGAFKAHIQSILRLGQNGLHFFLPWWLNFPCIGTALPPVCLTSCHWLILKPQSISCLHDSQTKVCQIKSGDDWRVWGVERHLRLPEEKNNRTKTRTAENWSVKHR